MVTPRSEYNLFDVASCELIFSEVDLDRIPCMTPRTIATRRTCHLRVSRPVLQMPPLTLSSGQQYASVCPRSNPGDTRERFLRAVGFE